MYKHGDALEFLTFTLTDPSEEGQMRIEEIRSEVTSLYRLDHLLAPEQLLPAAETLELVIEDALESPLPREDLRDVLAQLGELQCLIGWMSWNAGERMRAEGYFAKALRVAMEVGFHPLAAAVETYRSYVLAASGQHKAALQVLETASHQVDAGTDPLTTAWVHARLAEQASILEEFQRAERSLEIAQEAHAGHTEDGRNWDEFLSSQRLDSMMLSAWSRFNPQAAEDKAQALVQNLHLADTKTSAVIFADLALAYGRQGEYEPAKIFAEQATLITQRRGGGAVARRNLDELWSLLPADDHGTVGELRLLLKA